MRWRLTSAEGYLAGVPLQDVLANGGVLAGPLRGSPDDRHSAIEQAWLWEQVSQCLEDDRPTWVILPDRERARRDWWDEFVAGGVELRYGRAGVAQALGQMDRLQAPAALIALDRQPGHEPDSWTDSQLRLEWTPTDSGLGFHLNLVDGRLDGKTDVGVMLERARELLPRPELVICPGTGGDGALDRLMPFLGDLGEWVSRDVRWEFAEARVGPLGVVGSLYGWYWLHEGYRLGEWQRPSAVLDLDTSPLVGISVVDYAV